MKKEIWKEIRNYPNYQVSNLGRVKSLRRNLRGGSTRNQEIILKPRKTRLGYLLVAIYNPTRKDVSIHRLVGKSFVNNPYNKPDINHIDGVKSNNNSTNLEWVTKSENLKHNFKLGVRNVQGQNAPNSRLKNHDVLQIRKMHKDKIPISDICSKFNICESSVRQIANRTTWFNV